ncbi:hypothetical protein MKZ02_21085 [Pseudobacillus sp. FSL P4-0506]|uniref:hypothetical protein n=1 Tax=Pseudobacillus sp. FSL P4-0506 TaxID=2921576 RepID=UPI0030F9A75C
MTHQEKIVQVVAEMDEEKAKQILAEIFLNVDRVNGINYSQETCYQDIERLYKQEIVFELMKGK